MSAAPPPPLDYETPPEPPKHNVTAQAFMGCVAAAGFVGIAAFCGGVIGFSNRSKFAPGLPIMILLILAIAAIVSICVRDQNKPDQRGFVIGLWIGLGIGLLTIGLCFASL